MPIMIFMIRYYNSLRHTRRIISVFHNFKFNFLFLLAALLMAFVSSCEKGILQEGSDLLPKSDLVSINAIDTIHAVSYLRYDDSVRTDNPQYSYIGVDYSPYFGSSNSGFVSQIRLNPKWDGLSFTVDSMKLVLHILSVQGVQSDALHSISVYEIGNQIYTDSAYYSSSPVSLTGFKVANIPIPVLRTDTINDLVLDLPNKGVDFGNYLIRDTAKLFYSNSLPDFRAYFKGLYFEMDPSPDPLIMSLSLVYDQTKYYNYFVLYGHDNANAIVAYTFNLDAKNKNATFNVFKHDFTTATLGDKMAHRNTTYTDTLSYLQSLNGVYTKIALPGLEKIKNNPSFGKIAVNRARLTIPVRFNTENNTKFISKELPSNLYLRYKASTGIKYVVPDYSMSQVDVNHTFFDGKLDSVNKVYTFNIPAYIQSYLNDATGALKPEVEIYESSGLQDVIFEANKSKNPLKFEFTYTKF